jgi:UDP-N-acetylmuramoyl-L-alanyl-D-glutamate--2,6-diaminopimelate ligase
VRLSEVLQSAARVVAAPSLAITGSVDHAALDIDVRGIAISSNKVHSGYVFVALPGHRTHGANFVSDAIQRGATAVITDDEGKRILDERGAIDVPVITVAGPRRCAAGIAAALVDFPANSLALVGVTGTNGKTSVSFLISLALDSYGLHSGVIGTLGARVQGRVLDSGPRTTPEAADIHPILRSMLDDGVRAAVMEVSSIALCENRVDGILFDLAVFTGLSHDHLDYHGDMEMYFAAKAALFTAERARRAVVVIDDDWGVRLASSSTIPVITVSTRGREADWQVIKSDGLLFLRGRDQQVVLDVPVTADFVLANVAVAVVSACAMGVPLERAAHAAAHAQVPGRMELVAREGDVDFIVDYAHTPDAIEQVVSAARKERQDRTGGRVIVVIGAGGDRDPLKRADMGRASARADMVIVTDDNPRSENPAQIRSQVLSGLDSSDDGHEVVRHEIASRHDAIGRAVAEARAGDVVLVLGKGHETTQEGPDGVIAFDDRVVLASFVDGRFHGESKEGVT